RGRKARRGAEMGALARRGAVSPPLRAARPRRRRLGQAAAARPGRKPPLPGACRMIPGLDRLGRKMLFAFDPETAHGLSIAALKAGLPLGCAPSPDPALAVTVAGLSFANPLGMAAGYDK